VSTLDGRGVLISDFVDGTRLRTRQRDPDAVRPWCRWSWPVWCCSSPGRFCCSGS